MLSRDLQVMARLIACQRYIEIIELYLDASQIADIVSNPQFNKEYLAEYVDRALKRADERATKEHENVTKIYSALSSPLPDDGSYLIIS